MAEKAAPGPEKPPWSRKKEEYQVESVIGKSRFAITSASAEKDLRSFKFMGD